MTTTAIRHISVTKEEKYFIEVKSDNGKITLIIPCAKKLVETIEAISKEDEKKKEK